jgi:hypothetical protein
MKLLWLGSSNDVGGPMKDVPQPPAMAAEALSLRLGTEVEVVAKAVWPSPELPSIIRKWMEGEEPDLVYMKSRPYSFTYESVPLRIERMLGPLGNPLAKLGRKAADVPIVAHSSAFHGLRKVALRTIGGATEYTPQEVVATLEACVRTIIRSEKATFVLRGPVGNSDYYASNRARRRGEAKRQWADRALKKMCTELHVAYISADRPRYDSMDLDFTGDRVHLGTRGIAFEAEEAATELLKAWRATNAAEVT